MPVAQERRQTLRVLAVWRSLAGDSLPRRSAVDPRLFEHDWANCFLVDLDPEIERSRVAYLGKNLGDATWPMFDRQCLEEFRAGTLLRLATRPIAQVLDKRTPIGNAGIAEHEDAFILYRSILMPLSENGDKIDGLLGAINYRDASTEEIQAMLAA
ncbi:MAG TPA: PAS domain-containing protein [Stellaceae bacterium]|nr:PAS domain-containing protein [Stellaceae bacterium]